MSKRRVHVLKTCSPEKVLHVRIGEESEVFVTRASSSIWMFLIVDTFGFMESDKARVISEKVKGSSRLEYPLLLFENHQDVWKMLEKTRREDPRERFLAKGERLGGAYQVCKFGAVEIYSHVSSLVVSGADVETRHGAASGTGHHQ